MAYLKDGIIKDDTKDPGLQEARRKLNIMKMTTEEYRAYRDYMVSVHASEKSSSICLFVRFKGIW